MCIIGGIGRLSTDSRPTQCQPIFDWQSTDTRPIVSTKDLCRIWWNGSVTLLPLFVFIADNSVVFSWSGMLGDSRRTFMGQEKKGLRKRDIACLSGYFWPGLNDLSLQNAKRIFVGPRFSDHLFSQIIQNMRLNAINSFPVALFCQQAADDRSIVGRQSFMSLSVDRLSIDTFVSRLSSDRQWPSTDCHWLSVEHQYLNDRRSTDFPSIFGQPIDRQSIKSWPMPPIIHMIQHV